MEMEGDNINIRGQSSASAIAGNQQYTFHRLLLDQVSPGGDSRFAWLLIKRISKYTVSFVNRSHVCPVHTQLLTEWLSEWMNLVVEVQQSTAQYYINKEIFTWECSSLVSVFKATVYVSVMHSETNISHREALVWQRGRAERELMSL